MAAPPLQEIQSAVSCQGSAQTCITGGDGNGGRGCIADNDDSDDQGVSDEGEVPVQLPASSPRGLAQWLRLAPSVAVAEAHPTCQCL